MSKYIVSNSFTGYRAEINTKNSLPSLSTLRRHWRKSKASDCKSATRCHCADTGDEITIVDRGHGPEVVNVSNL